MTKHTILFAAANPQDSTPLAIDREARAIQAELDRARSRDQFELITRWAVEPMDLLRELRKLRPTVVHFSGHGQQACVGAGLSGRPRRGTIDGTGSVHQGVAGGLYFQSADGSARLVSADAIRQTFGAAGSSVRLVVLNACYSAAQAEALLGHVDCVVGMSGAISDDAARHFAVGFYGGLAEREPVAAAFRQGKAAISLEGLHESDLPQLRVRAGVNAERLILGESSTTRVAEVRTTEGVGKRKDLANIDIEKLRGGVTLGFHLGRLEFVMDSRFAEARPASIESQGIVLQLLRSDGWQPSFHHFEDLASSILLHYSTTNAIQHAAIMLGMCAFRLSLFRVQTGTSGAVELEQLAYSALAEIDEEFIPGGDRKTFFQDLKGVPSKIGDIVSFARKYDSEKPQRR